MQGKTLLDTIRNDAESFHRELSTEFYLEGAGLKDTINLSKIYSKYEHLADSQLIGTLKELLSRETDLSERRRLKMLIEMVVQTYLENVTKKYLDKILQAEVAGKIEWGKLEKKSASYRQSHIILMNEEDRTIRKMIAGARDSFVREQLNPYYETLYSTLTDHTEQLGFRNYTHLVESLSGINLINLGSEMERFLKETDAMYTDIFSWMVKRQLGLTIGEVERHDVMYMMRGKRFDHLFPAGIMVDSISRFVRAMRIDPTAGGNIQFDIEKRKNKSPRAFCVMIKVPEEIYLVIQPTGGEEDYEAFLHELGHALHFGYTDKSLPFEYKRLGDNSVTEAYAITFDHLTMNPAWLRKILNVPDDEDYLRHRSLNEFILLRRYAAKINYELQLHDGRGHSGKEEKYCELLTDATLTRYTGENYLNDVDPFFYAARYLRAWMLEAILSEYLTEHYDTDWFINPRTGECLVDLWQQGQAITGEELAAKLGGKTLSVDALIRKLQKVFG